VGSGKSSLFHALFGEMMHEKENPPSISINGSVSYVSQKPWVLNDTVKDNILFDKAYNETAYKEALRKLS
jgi:ABC-type transport system involved in cytochrome bd biosynthesis fused ATPase/permease subunit